MDLGQLKSAMMSSNRVGENFRRSPARPLDRRKINAVALLKLLASQSRLAQKSFESLGRRGYSRPLRLLARRFCPVGNVAHDQDQTPRRRMDVDRAGRQAGLIGKFGEKPRKFVASTGLHPRRNFLG